MPLDHINHTMPESECLVTSVIQCPNRVARPRQSYSARVMPLDHISQTLPEPCYLVTLVIWCLNHATRSHRSYSAQIVPLGHVNLQYASHPTRSHRHIAPRPCFSVMLAFNNLSRDTQLHQSFSIQAKMPTDFGRITTPSIEQRDSPSQNPDNLSR